MKKGRIDVYFVCSGKYHDIDFARMEILKLLSKHECIRTRVAEDYRDIDAIRNADFLITYTCEVIPTPDQQKALRDYISEGGRWIALHGTNSILKFMKGGKVACPDNAPLFMELLGSQFAAHPPLQDFEITVSDVDHELTRNLQPFTVEDEIYLIKNAQNIHCLLETRWTGTIREFEDSDWTEDAPRPVMYLNDFGKGQVLYLTLGHCRGKYDMQPLIDEYYRIERCSWKSPVFYELLERSILWASTSGEKE
ncbi:ThuA domain-containing protein [Emcibacter sp.]|uniref:ThuA domain-containing protein n=1 Tax=Emcibacter sp. TaxID=1979954 RepID=UPI002AA87EDC|nr:ThuA domain-containing protein [Emcibacter sp.]